MRTKNIKKAISEKLDKWFESIDDETVRNQVKKNTIVTGGCIPSMLLNEPVNDYDIYFRDIETCTMVAKYYIEKFISNNSTMALRPVVQIFEPPEATIESDRCEIERVRIYIKSSGILKDNQYSDDDLEEIDIPSEGLKNNTNAARALRDSKASKDKNKNLFKPIFLSDNAITLSDKIQLVMRFYGEPETVHKYFDFVHATSYYTSWDKNLVLNPDGMESMLTRDLFYIGSKYPLCSLFRTKKFVERGWTCSAGQMVKMALQLNDFDLKNMDVLREQLIGVDTAYMSVLIDRLSTIDDNQALDTSYIIKVIDEVFDMPRNEVYDKYTEDGDDNDDN